MPPSSKANRGSPEHALTSHVSSSNNIDITHKDLPLLDHYLRHTCHAQGLSSSYAYARRIGLPALASKNKGVLCSILAFGAACLCVDLLLGPNPLAAIDQIAHLIKRSDYYHGIALTTIQSQLGAVTPKDLDIAHAHAAMLIGYAPARRRIFRLLQRQQLSPALVEQERGADSPNNLDWAVFIRGLKTVAKARETCSYQEENDDASASVLEENTPDVVLSAYVAQAVELEREQVKCLSPCATSPSTFIHAMKNIISSSVAQALDTLYEQIHILEVKLRQEHCKDIWSRSLAGIEALFPIMGSLLACHTAVTMLEATANDIFGPLRLSGEARSHAIIHSRNETTSGDSKEWFTLKDSPWLHESGARRGKDESSELAMEGVFRWIGHLPREYFDIVTCHYPEHSKGAELSLDQQIHCLAWDVYAHWLVFTFLLKDEVWWWADMGLSDVQKLRDTLPKADKNGYSVDVGIHNWWPWQMWSLAKELRIGKDDADRNVDDEDRRVQS